MAKLRKEVAAGLALMSAPSFALDPGVIHKAVTGFGVQAVDNMILNPQVQEFVIGSQFAAVALIASAIILYRSWSEGKNALMGLLTIVLAVMITAITIRIYPGVTGALMAYGTGLTKLIDTMLSNGLDPVELVSKASTLVYNSVDADTDKIGLFIRWMYEKAIYLGIILLQALMWLYMVGSDWLFLEAKVIGFFTLPFVLFRWSSSIPMGALGVMLFCVILKMMAAVHFSFVALEIEKYLQITGGGAVDVGTADYGALGGLIGVLAPSVGIALMLGGITAMLVRGRDLSIDAGGIVGGGLAAAGKMLSAGRDMATRRAQ
jgi:hypothetical protein